MIRIFKVESRRELKWQLTWFLAWLGITLFAVFLHPKDAGHGTHTELGLPPCPCVLIFGRPCPGCGLTTSFTATVHGDWRLAFRAHPLGPMLYLLLTLVGWLGMITFLRKEKVDTTTRSFSRLAAGFVIVFFLFGVARFVLSPHYGDHDPFHQWYLASR